MEKSVLHIKSDEASIVTCSMLSKIKQKEIFGSLNKYKIMKLPDYFVRVGNKAAIRDYTLLNGVVDQSPSAIDFYQRTKSLEVRNLLKSVAITATGGLSGIASAYILDKLTMPREAIFAAFIGGFLFAEYGLFRLMNSDFYMIAKDYKRQNLSLEEIKDNITTELRSLNQGINFHK